MQSAQDQIFCLGLFISVVLLVGITEALKACTLLLGKACRWILNPFIKLIQTLFNISIRIGGNIK